MSPYASWVDFGRACTIALCSTMLYDDALASRSRAAPNDIFQPRRAGTTLEHITRQLVTWRQAYRQGCLHGDKGDERIMSSLGEGQYFSPAFCLSEYCVGDTVANAVKSFERDVGWQEMLGYIAKYLPQVIIGDEKSDNVSCLSSLIQRREADAIRVIIRFLNKLPPKCATYFASHIADDVELFREMLKKGSVSKEAKKIFTLCYNARNIPYVKALSSCISFRNMGASSMAKIHITDASKELFTAGAEFLGKTRDEMVCVFLGYREGFLRYLPAIKKGTITEEDDALLHELICSCIRLNMYTEELFAHLASVGATVALEEPALRTVLLRLKQWGSATLENFSSVLLVPKNSVTASAIVGRFCECLGKWYVGDGGKDVGDAGLLLLGKIIRGCTSECYDRVVEVGGRATMRSITASVRY